MLRCKEVVKRIVGMLLSGAHTPIVQFSSAEHRIYIYDSSAEHKSLFHIKLRGAGIKLNVEEEEINISSEEHNVIIRSGKKCSAELSATFRS